MTQLIEKNLQEEKTKKRRTEKIILMNEKKENRNLTNCAGNPMVEDR